MHQVYIKHINNTLWIIRRKRIDVYSQNGKFVRNLRKPYIVENICQTFTGDIIASAQSHVVKYSTKVKKWLDLCRGKHVIDDLITQGCEFLVVFCVKREIQTYRIPSPKKGWKFQASIIIDRRIDYRGNCKLMVHKDMIFVYNDAKIQQFSKEGHFMKHLSYDYPPNMLGIDRNGWLLVYHYNFGSKLRVYNSTSLTLHKHLNLIHDVTSSINIVSDANESSICVLTEKGYVKYTV